MSLLTTIKSCYTKARGSGNLIFFDSALTNVVDQGVKFEVRVASVLAKMADTSPEDKKNDKAFVNPFLKPEKELIISDINSGYLLLLNKFCIIPYHLLLVSKTFIEQGTPLNHVDFDAILQVVSKMTEPSVTFYNSGTNSGASQPHKHIQIVPLTTGLEESPVVALWLRSQPQVDEVFSSHELGFVHWGVKLNPKIMELVYPETDSLDKVTEYLKEQYMNLLKEIFKFWTYSKAAQKTSIGSLPLLSESTPFDPALTLNMSYNLIFTKSAMLIIPRSVRDTEGIPINSLAFAGLLLCKSDEQSKLVSETGPLKILAASGFPSQSSSTLKLNAHM
ncbi:hypothetical protein BB560_001936 [Smittium megazygosporum]|uniref:Uncharacterized protein n=1 Tax=Smittium megazygosporum TaxID=133381 RepID=A0A2T9ZG68_9FUNG|nr:hypothetical protein BB560_001936 [Smittium megazygosporum]